MEQHNRISGLVINGTRLLTSSGTQSERQRVITDILNQNAFSMTGHTGPFSITAALIEHRYILDISDSSGHVVPIGVPLTPLKRTMKDYRIVCESYFQALQTADPGKVEAIDMGRRSLHNEGADILAMLLPPSITTDFQTLRKLFTLFYLLQIR